MKYESLEYDDWMKYKAMFREMDSMETFIIAGQIGDLGFPMFTDSIPTAAVSLSRTNDVIFMFNREFFRSLSPKDLAFVFIHEMLHVAFKHFERAIRLKVFNENGTADPIRAPLLNIAADCLVNTWGLNLGFDVTDEFKEKYMVLPEKIGYTNFTSSTTVEDIYHWLCKQNEETIKALEQMASMDTHESWSNNKGPSMDSFEEKVVTAMKDEFFKAGGKNLDKKALEERKKQIDSNQKKSKSMFIENHKPLVGNQPIGEPRHYRLIKERVSIDVLRKIHLKIKSCIDDRPKETWARPNKKLFSQYPEIIMPTEWDLDVKDKYATLASIDASGSITDEMISQIVRYCRSFPLDKMEYVPIAWDTNVYELNKKEFYDKNKYPVIPGRGGTDISCTEKYIQDVYVKRFKRRPDLVVILTDGMGSFDRPIAPQHQKNYVWILTKSHDENAIKTYCPGGLIFKTNIQ